MPSTGLGHAWIREQMERVEDYYYTYKTKKNTRRGVKDSNGCKRLAVLSEKVLHEYERPAVLPEKFCMDVRDPWCNPKSSVA